MGRALVSAPATLGALAALLVCWSLQTGWKASFGPLFQWLGNLGLTIPIPHFPNVSIHPFSFALTIDHNVRAWLSQGIALSERAFVKFLWYTVEPFLLMAGVTLALALAFYELGAYVVPRLGHAVAQATHGVSRGVIALVNRVVHYEIGRFRRAVDQLLGRQSARIAHAQHTADAAYEFPRPRFGRIEKTKVNSKDLTKWLKVTLLGTLGSLVVARALGKIGLGCLLGRNGKKAVGSLCKVNPHILDALLVDALTLTVAFNLEEFAKEMQTVTGEAARLIHKFAN